FFEMGLEDERFYGAWNFDVFANLLRRVGIGVEHYGETLSKVYSNYYEQGIPPGTFSTCIRDFYLDFGWAGVAVGAIAMVTLSQFFFKRVVYFHRVDRLPYLGFSYAMLGISPLFSGLQVGSANLSLCGVIAGAFLMRNVGKPVPVVSAPVAPGLQWRQGKKPHPKDE
ncbi:MAG: oligosaccharide repeat unit polymerase, partial [Candidatus Didemnitutus sp.]|nr:oligosaccharide repeat unit polymerase [Candidatus Didemnitutus sp.]